MTRCRCAEPNGKQCKSEAISGGKFCMSHLKCKTVYYDDYEVSGPGLVLPTEILIDVLMHVDPKEMKNLCATSRMYAVLCEDPIFKRNYAAKWHVENMVDVMRSMIRIDMLRVDLRKMGLTSLPSEIGSLLELRELEVSGVKSDTIPSSIGQLSNLTILTITDSNIVSLPNEIGNLTNLTKLDISRNKLTSIPETIGNLRNLTILDISINKITSIPPSIGNLSKLRVLHMRGDYGIISPLPASMLELKNLRRIRVNYVMESDPVLRSLIARGVELQSS